MKPILRDSELLTGRALGETYLRENKTESYVEVPPALIITDPSGTTFTMGFRYIEYAGHFEFNVLRDDIDTGEFAEKIVMQAGTVRIFGKDRWRTWNGRTFI